MKFNDQHDNEREECPLCGEPGSAEVIEHRENDLVFWTVRCQQCGVTKDAQPCDNSSCERFVRNDKDAVWIESEYYDYCYCSEDCRKAADEAAREEALGL